MSTWVKAAGAASGAKGWVKTGGKWVPMEVPAGLKGLGGWADITAVTGSPVKHSYTDADGDWVAYEWKAVGSYSVTITKGLVDVCVVGGGCPNSGANSGAAGHVITGTQLLQAGKLDIVVGKAGTNNDTSSNNVGKGSMLGPVRTGMASIYSVGAAALDFPWGSNPIVGGSQLPSQMTEYGIVSSITGTAIEYGRAGQRVGGPGVNPGDGANSVGQAASPGCVIIRVPKSHAKA